ncbi:mandelate racemase/muconate lactonizing enzyme family protein [Rhizobium hidalgonense]|uniref:Mandelate racemase/muconate lactonizing enzyme family protein n=1 Tax=Rhizobium hidalgonense TaxID=1538159 RepID=A0AAJ2GWH9_9HYPH|nr:mandelate racemase/muconate lactonizing enzyme family protein [Rhizobium hidalgonense]MDR9774672.1 mandelate racemase/muconate lactonizing enzyme family protein [Rhizobium hidalgonense]MDR9814796.1 mandelate racemase/muconate lactonizing enzyme family protein [Rhizobium hidalgonense]MDR9818352.1 mandelate racemase/muconate lactonizing enzyme family protein [Rhizobium hidalgonense]
MKITDIRTYLMQVGPRPGLPGQTSAGAAGEADFRGSRNWLFVKVETDEGIYGIGECSGWPRVVEAAVKDYRAILIGEDPRDIDRIWSRMFVSSMGHGTLGTVGGGALTGIEMALWDIKGKALNQPIWNLLGGRFRDRIKVYGHAKTPDRARELLERGYQGVKVGFTGAVDLDKVASIRDTIGADVDLMVDAHGPSWMTTKDAILVGRALEPLDLLFLEDPVAPENLDALERIRDAIDVPLAAGERVSNIWGIRQYIERDLVDVIQPDTGRAGGITQMRKMAAMAEAHYITVAPHSGSLGPIAEFAALHVMATIPNALMLERVEFDWSGRYEVVTPVLKVEDGHLPVPDAPGLGVELVEEEIEKYPSNRNVGDMPADDGRAYEPGTLTECVYFQTRLRRRARLRLAKSSQ